MKRLFLFGLTMICLKILGFPTLFIKVYSGVIDPDVLTFVDGNASCWNHCEGRRNADRGLVVVVVVKCRCEIRRRGLHDEEDVLVRLGKHNNPVRIMYVSGKLEAESQTGSKRDS